MKIERKDVVKYLASLKTIDKEHLLQEVRQLQSEKEEKRYRASRAAYNISVAKKEARGEEMKKSVKPKMVVICEGTRDRLGLREVLEVNENGIVARKIEKRRNEHGVFFVRAPYITEHNWSKVKRIVSGIISIE